MSRQLVLFLSHSLYFVETSPSVTPHTGGCQTLKARAASALPSPSIAICSPISLNRNSIHYIV